MVGNGYYIPQGTAYTQPFGLVANASRFQPSGGTPNNVKKLDHFCTGCLELKRFRTDSLGLLSKKKEVQS